MTTITVEPIGATNAAGWYVKVNGGSVQVFPERTQAEYLARRLREALAEPTRVAAVEEPYCDVCGNSPPRTPVEVCRDCYDVAKEGIEAVIGQRVADAVAKEREECAKLAYEMHPQKGWAIATAFRSRTPAAQPTRRTTVEGEYTVRLDPVIGALEAGPGLGAETPDAAHAYTSTACHHKKHKNCRRVCKFCPESCACACHSGECRDRIRVPDDGDVDACAKPKGHAGAHVGVRGSVWDDSFTGRLARDEKPDAARCGPCGKCAGSGSRTVCEGNAITSNVFSVPCPECGGSGRAVTAEGETSGHGHGEPRQHAVSGAAGPKSPAPDSAAASAVGELVKVMCEVEDGLPSNITWLEVLGVQIYCEDEEAVERELRTALSAYAAAVRREARESLLAEVLDELSALAEADGGSDAK